MNTQAKDILDQLPRLLREDPELKARLYQLLLGTFPAREELAAVLDEMRADREAADRRFDELGRRWEELRRESNERFETMRRESDERFEKQRQESDERFEKQRQEGDERFEKQRQESEKRFEQQRRESDERFAAIRRESADQWAEMRRESDERFAAMRKENAEQFADMRKEATEHFTAVMAESRRQFEAINRRFDAIRDDLRVWVQSTRHWVDIVGGGFQRRAGRGLEDAIAGTLRLALLSKDLQPDTIRLRQKITDADGVVGPAGRTYEYDLIVANGGTVVFEVKSMPDEEDVQRFADKCELVTRALKLDRPRKVIVTLAKSEELLRHCEALGVELV